MLRCVVSALLLLKLEGGPILNVSAEVHVGSLTVLKGVLQCVLFWGLRPRNLPGNRRSTGRGLS